MNKQLVAIVKQAGGVVLPDNASHTNRIEIKSESSNRVYTVSQNKTTGEWQCSCPGWTMKKAGRARTCKHLQAMVPTLQAALAAAPKQLG